MPFKVRANGLLIRRTPSPLRRAGRGQAPARGANRAMTGGRHHAAARRADGLATSAEPPY